MVKKPTLYLEIDGPIIIPHEDGDPFLDGALAPYAKPFLHWATQHFDVQAMCETDLKRAFHAFRTAGLPRDAIPVRGYMTAKSDMISPNENFYWVDSILTPREIGWLHEHGLGHRVITVDPEIGIEESHKNELARRLKL